MLSPNVFVEEYGVGLGRLLGVNDGIKWVVVHFDEVERITGNIAARGNDHRDWFANVTDLALSQYRVIGVTSCPALLRTHGTEPV